MRDMKDGGAVQRTEKEKAPQGQSSTEEYSLVWNLNFLKIFTHRVKHFFPATLTSLEITREENDGFSRSSRLVWRVRPK